MWARTATDFVDPAMDGLFGGGAGTYNPFGAPSENHFLGWETDLSVSYTWKNEYGQLALALQYGHLFPGDVFESASGEKMDDIDKIQVRCAVVW